MPASNALIRPEGVYPAMLTPFEPDGRVNETELRRLVRWLMNTGVSGLFPLGSCGESIHMERPERKRVLDIVVSEAAGRVPVFPGTGSSCAENAAGLTRMARDAGANGAVVAPPYFFPVSQELIEAYFTHIAAAVPGFPIVMYNIPAFTTAMRCDVAARLARIPNIVGMKDSSGNMIDFVNFLEMTTAEDPDFHMLTGREETLFPCLAMGGWGTMSASTGIIPEAMLDILAAYKSGDMKAARRNQLAILALVRAMSDLPFPLGFKIALELRGFAMGPPRQTLPASEEARCRQAREQIRGLMEQPLGDRLVAQVD